MVVLNQKPSTCCKTTTSMVEDVSQSNNDDRLHKESLYVFLILNSLLEVSLAQTRHFAATQTSSVIFITQRSLLQRHQHHHHIHKHLLQRQDFSWVNRFALRYESSTLILYKELSSPIFQSCLSVCQASVTTDQISTSSYIYRHTSPLLTLYHLIPVPVPTFTDKVPASIVIHWPRTIKYHL